MAASDQTGTVARVVAILGMIAETEGPISVTAAARETGLPASTMHRLFDLLVQNGMLVHDRATRRYRVGLELYRIANLVVSGTPLQDVAGPVLDRVKDETNETAVLSLHVPDRDTMMYVAKSDSPQPLRYRIDLFQTVPLAWGASGHAILAFLDEETVDRVIAAAEPSLCRPDRKVDPDALRDRLRKVREQGFAVTFGEKLDGAVGVSVPVFRHGEAFGSLSLTIPQVRFSESAVPALVDALRRAASQLGSRGDDTRPMSTEDAAQ